MDKRVFTEKERMEIARLHIKQGKTIKCLASNYNVSESAIGRWIVRYRNNLLAAKTEYKDGGMEK